MKIFLIKFTAFYIACFLCYTLQSTFGLSPVLSSALIGFIGSFYWFSYKVEKAGIHAVIYAGSFAGMASPEYLSGFGHILLISLVGTSLYFWSKPLLKWLWWKTWNDCFYLNSSHDSFAKECHVNIFTILVISQLSAQSTHALALTKHFGSVRASSSLTLLFIGITSLLSLGNTLPLHAVFLGSSFVGMTDPKRLSRLQIGMSSIVFSFIFYFLISYLKGPGGVLGFSAFMSCLIVHFIWRIVMRHRLNFRRPD